MKINFIYLYIFPPQGKVLTFSRYLSVTQFKYKLNCDENAIVFTIKSQPHLGLPVPLKMPNRI